jgi:hypothetical protein
MIRRYFSLLACCPDPAEDESSKASLKFKGEISGAAVIRVTYACGS